MNIDYENARTINIQKQWDGVTDENLSFTIDGGWNDFDGHYVDSVEFHYDSTGQMEMYSDDETNDLIAKITEEFLNEMNG